MKCTKCGCDSARSYYGMKGVVGWVCSDCAAGMFQRKWLALRKRFTKLNRKLKGNP